jgi:cell division septation protein DedD
MSQPANQAVLSNINELRTTSGDPDFDPAAFAALHNDFIPAGETGETDLTQNIWNGRIEGGEHIVDLPDDIETFNGLFPFVPPMVVQEEPEEPYDITSETVLEVVEAPVLPEPESTELEITEPNYELSLVPAETRPPEGGLTPDPAFIIPGIGPAPVAPPPVCQPVYIDPFLIIDPIGEAPLVQPEELPRHIDPSLIIDPIGEAPLAQQPQELPQQIEPVQPFTPAPVVPEAPPAPVFPAPLISSLEEGKYYLQIAAFSNEEAVRYELSKIDSNLPRAVMNAGCPENPVFRVLIGPVNLGESGALLYRFRRTHSDAFIRAGS